MVSSDQPDPLAPGARIADYVLGEKLGEGATSVVYAALEPRIEKHVAIKVLKSAIAADGDEADRVLREARAVNAVRHPAIVDVFAHGRLADGRPYLVMSRLEGRSLDHALAEHGRYAPAEAWRIMREVAAALGAAHAVGIVHRDLKPANVFLENASGGARARVLDFGLARVDAHPNELAASQTGRPVGTPLYMAPEQWWGRGVDARTDQYALGAMLFEMLAGAPPFEAPTYVDILEAHLHRAPPTLASKGVTATPALEAFVARLLAKSSTERFASMDEVVAAGDEACGRAGPGAPAPPPTEALARGVTPAHARAFDSAPLLVLGVGALVVSAIGYAGDAPHDPRGWLVMAGYPGPIGLVLATMFALLAAFGRTRSAAFAASMLALAMAPGSHTDWNAVERSVAAFEPAARFLVVHVGAYEASAVRFVGGALLALVFAIASWGLPPARGVARAHGDLRARDLRFAAISAALLGVAGALLGAPMLAFVALVTLLVVGGAARYASRAPGEATRLADGVLAIAFALIAAVARVDGREGFAWTDAATRAERAELLARANDERLVTYGLGSAILLVGVAVALASASKLVRARASFAALVPRGRGALSLLLGVAFFVGDATYVARVARARRAIGDALAPQFALFAALDPPTTSLPRTLTPEPSAAPALQVSREVVAVQGRRVARLDALASTASQAAIANALCPAIAEGGPRTDSAIAPPDLSLLLDESTPRATLQRLLALASDCGARRVELLLVRGSRASFSPRVPREASFAVPSDFVSLRIDVGGGEGDDLPAPDATALVRAAERAAIAGRTARFRVK